LSRPELLAHEGWGDEPGADATEAPVQTLRAVLAEPSGNVSRCRPRKFSSRGGPADALSWVGAEPHSDFAGAPDAAKPRRLVLAIIGRCGELLDQIKPARGSNQNIRDGADVRG
jgi:hypothetical protein